MRRLFFRIASGFYTIVLLFFTAGCLEPGVRYTRDEQGKVHMFVPADWDYRINYVVPQTRLKLIADSYLGIHYKNGGTNKKGVDCSGFVFLVFQELTLATIPRSSGELWKMGRMVDPDLARPGDLVFFRGGIFSLINHVGIYMGNNTFIHASTKGGVMYNALDDEYYKKRYAGIRRIF